MAASTALESGELTMVYFRIGKFPNDQRAKFVEAPFVLIKIFGEEYIMPSAVGGNAEDLKGSFATDAVTTEQIMGRNDFGFYNCSPLICNENEWGGFQKAGPDVVQQLHSFSLI